MLRKKMLFAPLVVLVAVCASAQITTVVKGLNNPRGLAFGPGGVLYVGEAGLGAGNGSGGVGAGLGYTGAVGKISNLSSPSPSYRRIVTGLVSNADSGGVTGPDGVSVLGNGNINIIMSESTEKILAENPNADPIKAAGLGKLLQSSQSGRWKVKADVGDFDYEWSAANADQPWAPPAQFPDSNPYAVLSVPGHQYIADAGSNTINEVSENGSIRTIAFVPNPVLGGQMVSDSVPTCVAQGADGYLYVGTLAFGAYFASGHQATSQVYRFSPTLSNVVLTDADVWASGFYPITGCGFANGAFYVTEYFTATPAAGALVKVAVNPDGSPGARTVMGGHQLHFPNGFAAGSDGSVYVSNFSTSPGTAQTAGAPVGEVVRVDY